MKTRIIKVRRRRPSGVIWAVSLMVISLALYLITSAPPIKRALSAVDEEESAQTVGKRITQDITFPAVSDYLIQFGAFMDSENARIEAGRYVNRGAAGYILYEDGMYRVIGAEYGSREEAERVKERLKDDEAMECQINAVGSPGATMRVTATQVQIDAFANANDALTETLDAMRALAYKVDGGETAKDEALGELKNYGSSVANAYDELKLQSGNEPNSVARDLMSLLLACENTLDQLVQMNHENILSFSSQIKYNTINMRLSQIDFLKKLSV